MIYRCWNCGNEVDTDTAEKCKKCYWFVCDLCNSCGCEYFEERESEEEYHERRGEYDRDYIYDEFGEREEI